MGSASFGGHRSPPRPGSGGRTAAHPAPEARPGKRAWKRFWSWRRIRFTRTGLFLTAGAAAVGLAGINTGNNLLYLLLGILLGLMAVSSWVSEEVVGGIRIRREVPQRASAGHPIRVSYEVDRGPSRFPALNLRVGEEGHPGWAVLPFLGKGETRTAARSLLLPRRGVVRLSAMVVSTTAPFGFFEKLRNLEAPAEILVWPRIRPAPHPPPKGASGGGRRQSPAVRVPFARGEYRALRPYRPGDEPRDIHWRTTARLGAPVVREYGGGETQSVWICLDLRRAPGEEAEALVEVAADLARNAFREGRRFGLATQGVRVEPGEGEVQFRRVMDALALVEFRPDAPPFVPPTHPRWCLMADAPSRLPYQGTSSGFSRPGKKA